MTIRARQRATFSRGNPALPGARPFLPRNFTKSRPQRMPGSVVGFRPGAAGQRSRAAAGRRVPHGTLCTGVGWQRGGDHDDNTRPEWSATFAYANGRRDMEAHNPTAPSAPGTLASGRCARGGGGGCGGRVAPTLAGSEQGRPHATPVMSASEERRLRLRRRCELGSV